MTEKVYLAIIDKDLKIRKLKKYPLAESGQQILVKSGGGGHFMPTITNTSYLEFPYRALTSPWKLSFRRIYFATNLSKDCIDFKSGNVPLPSIEQLEESVKISLVSQMGKDRKEGPQWYHWAIIFPSILTFLIVLTTSGVIR